MEDTANSDEAANGSEQDKNSEQKDIITAAHDTLHSTIGTGMESLHDTERVFQVVKEGLGILIGFSVVSVAVSFGVYYVQHDQPLRVLISTILGWSGYVFAHYHATGKFIHQRQEQRMLPRTWSAIIGGLFGVLVLVSGITIWAVSLSRGDLLTTIIGAFIFMLGYLIAHYEFAGDLL